DAMLMMSGKLDLTRSGPHPFPKPTTWNFTQHKPFAAVYESNHRSVYLMVQRSERHPYLAIFDGADPNVSTAARSSTTTPLQALFVMNSKFINEQAYGFAKRLVSATTAAKRIEEAYRMAFARPTTAEEATEANAYLRQARQKLEAEGVAAPACEEIALSSY